MRINNILIVATTCIFLFLGCKKNSTSSQNNTVVISNFTGTLDNSPFSAQTDSAVYYPKWHELIIYTYVNNEPKLHVCVTIDSLNPVRNYQLESNGENYALTVGSFDIFYTDYNIADAGGNITITEFDTTQHVLSGNLQFVCYNPSGGIRKVFSNGVINQMPLIVNNVGYDGTYAECNINGVHTNTWHTRNMTANIDCWTGNNRRLRVRMQPILPDFFNDQRYIEWTINLNNPVGVYQIQTPTWDCSLPIVTSTYQIHDMNKQYQPVSGTFTITNIDTALRKLDASFAITYREPTSQQEIQITNGHFHLINWY